MSLLNLSKSLALRAMLVPARSIDLTRQKKLKNV